MRKIKFRGKNSYGGWDYGNLVCYNGVMKIFFADCYGQSVKPESVGQYTGLKDMNGKDIYEGDILSTKDRKQKYVVTWDERSAAFIVENKCRYCFWLGNLSFNHFEIIGNVYENADFLNHELE